MQLTSRTELIEQHAVSSNADTMSAQNNRTESRTRRHFGRKQMPHIITTMLWLSWMSFVELRRNRSADTIIYDSLGVDRGRSKEHSTHSTINFTFTDVFVIIILKQLSRLEIMLTNLIECTWRFWVKQKTTICHFMIWWFLIWQGHAYRKPVCNNSE